MPMKKVCPRCGATFDCMHNDILSCHCATVRLDALQRTYLMENYSDCLCHDCLKAVKDSFYACEINPRYNKKKNAKERIDCKQRWNSLTCNAFLPRNGHTDRCCLFRSRPHFSSCDVCWLGLSYRSCYSPGKLFKYRKSNRDCQTMQSRCHSSRIWVFVREGWFCPPMQRGGDHLYRPFRRDDGSDGWQDCRP